MIASKIPFDKEISFFNFTVKLIDQDLGFKNKLYINKQISILEIYKPYLILYVLPNILSKNIFLSYFRCVKLAIKIFLKSNLFLNYSLKVDSNLFIKSENKKKVALINFTKHFFDESLNKLQINEHQYLAFSTINIYSDNSNYISNSQILLKNKLIYNEFLKILKSNHRNFINKFGVYNKLELYLNLRYLFLNIIPGQILFMNDVVENQKLNNFDVIIANDFAEPISRFLLLYCKEIGIKTVIIQQGVSSLTYPEWKFNFTDYTFVSGQKTKDHIQFQNQSLNNVIVTGVPNFDIERYFKIKYDKLEFKILLATQPFFPYSFESRMQRFKIFSSIIFLCLRNKKISLTIKPHPSESIILYKFLSFFSPRLQITKKPIMESFDGQDIFITSFSQTSIYSTLVGIPTINVFYSNKNCHVDFIYSGATLLIESYFNLKFYLKNINSVYEYDYNINKLFPWIYNRDNNSVKRIQELLISI